MISRERQMANLPFAIVTPPDPVQLSRNLNRIAERSLRLIQNFLSRSPEFGSMGISDPGGVGSAFIELTTKMMADPSAVARAQIDLWNENLLLWQQMTGRFLGLTEGRAGDVGTNRPPSELLQTRAGVTPCAILPVMRAVGAEIFGRSPMTPDIVGALRTMVKNPYLDTYKEMTEYELTVWKQVFERSIQMRPSREKVLRLRAINRALRILESTRIRDGNHFGSHAFGPPTVRVNHGQGERISRVRGTMHQTGKQDRRRA
jgi:hypothetical protein